MEWDIKKYEEFSEIQFRIGKITLQKLNAQPNERILDIGCGIGNLTKIIAENVGNGEVIGIDNDENMINACKELINLNNIKNLKIIKKNAAEIEFDEEFDATFSNIVLHWIKDVSNLFKLIYKSLKIGGRLCIATICTDPHTPIQVPTDNELKVKDLIKISEIELRYLQNFIANKYYKYIFSIEEFMAYQPKVDKNIVYKTNSYEELLEMLKNAKFKDISIEKRYFTNQIDDIEVYLNYRQSNLWIFFLAFFPEKYRLAVKNRLKELIRSEWNELPSERKEFPIKEKWPVLFIQAKKI